MQFLAWEIRLMKNSAGLQRNWTDDWQVLGEEKYVREEQGMISILPGEWRSELSDNSIQRYLFYYATGLRPALIRGWSSCLIPCFCYFLSPPD